MADEGIARFDGSDWISFAGRGHAYGSTVGPEGTLWQPTAGGISGFDGSESISFSVSPDVAPRGVPDLTLIPTAAPVTTATPIGDITWYRFTAPISPGVFDVTTTPYGLMAVGDGALRWSASVGARARRSRRRFTMPFCAIHPSTGSSST